MPKQTKSKTMHTIADIARIDAYDCAMLSLVEAAVTTVEQLRNVEFAGCSFKHDPRTNRDEAQYNFIPATATSFRRACSFDVQGLLSDARILLAHKNMCDSVRVAVSAEHLDLITRAAGSVPPAATHQMEV